ncbi:MAG: 50S ribosomal protein L35 [Chloroflexi bacterium]|nr:50S ribosomal protein L35 [Chloroflexota bacterium]
MPKIKTHKGAARRFHLTGSGKVVRTKGPKSHLRRNKAKRVRRLFAGKVPAAPGMARRVKPFLPKQ